MVAEENMEGKPWRVLVNPEGHSAMLAQQTWLIASCVAATWDELRAELRMRQAQADLSDEKLGIAAGFTPEMLGRFLSAEPEYGPSLYEMVHGTRILGCFFEFTRPDLGSAPVHTVVGDDNPEWSVYEAERIIKFLKFSRIARGISRDDLESRIGALGVVEEMEQGEPDAEFRHVLAITHALDIGLILIDDLANPSRGS